MFHVPEKFRIRSGPMASDASAGNNGAFVVPLRKSLDCKVIASNGLGWEHVSISLSDRAPRWEEMCFIKDVFWDAEDVVMQLHPRKSEYINCHPFCLHLWRPVVGNGLSIPEPPKILIGPG